MAIYQTGSLNGDQLNFGTGNSNDIKQDLSIGIQDTINIDPIITGSLIIHGNPNGQVIIGSGNSSLAENYIFGSSNSANTLSDRTILIGNDNSAGYGDSDSISIGFSNSLNSTKSISIGTNNISYGGLAAGEDNYSFGSFVIGERSSGITDSVSIGISNYSQDTSVAIGHYNRNYPNGGSKSYLYSFGHGINLSGSGIMELGFWGDPNDKERKAGIQIHKLENNSGFAAISFPQRDAPINSSTLDSNPNNTLPKNSYALRRKNQDIYIDYASTGNTISTRINNQPLATYSVTESLNGSHPTNSEEAPSAHIYYKGQSLAISEDGKTLSFSYVFDDESFGNTYTIDTYRYSNFEWNQLSTPLSGFLGGYEDRALSLNQNGNVLITTNPKGGGSFGT